MEFIVKLAALVPKPRVNLTRFYGVFAPNSKYRTEVTPARRGKGNPSQSKEDKTPEQRHQTMTWAQRLKRVFNINVSICPKCGGETNVIACIENHAVIDKIVQHLWAKGVLPPPPESLPATRASPDADWFAQHPVFTPCYTARQQKNRLLGGMLLKLSRKVRKAVEEGRFSRKSRVLNRLRSDRPMFQAYPASSFLS
ncbi:MAG: transposase [Candidatus Thiodiazotropha sp. (ex Lucina pensylvanica)]|nr:transposase [Candidatus Thiodiazotropha sp. (ex Lucina pensylvanica)]